MSFGPDPDLAGMIERAAKGDVTAQRAMVDHAMAKAVGGEVSFAHAVQVGEAFARLAAVHGGTADRRMLAAMLCYAAQVARNEGRTANDLEYQVEALWLLNSMADAGDEDAARLLVTMAGGFDPEAIAQAAAGQPKSNTEKEAE